MRLSRIFLTLIFPFVLLVLGAWVFAAGKESLGVRVAGEVVGRPSLKLEVISFEEVMAPDGKRFQVELNLRNTGDREAQVNPHGFQLVVSHSLYGAAPSTSHQTYAPMNVNSFCEEAPGSSTRIPKGASRRIILTFWGDNVPANWKDLGYRFSIEYFDEESSTAFSRAINPR